MIFRMPQKKAPNYRLTIAGSHIEFVDNFNFLGITIDKHLSWTYHINLLCAKISKITGLINKLKNVLPVDILRTIYHSLILCHLTYGVLLWGAQLNENDEIHKLTNGKCLICKKIFCRQLRQIKSP